MSELQIELIVVNYRADHKADLSKYDSSESAIVLKDAIH